MESDDEMVTSAWIPAWGLGRGPSRTRISAKHAWQRVRAVAPALCRSIGFVHSQVVGECSGGGCPV